MIETFDKQIADCNGSEHHYQITQFAARRGFGIQTRLIKAVAPLIAGIDIKANGGTMWDAAVAINAQHLVNSLLANLDEARTEKLLLDLFAATRRDGQEINGTTFDMAYAANYGELAKAALAVIEVNGFFGMSSAGGGLSALLNKAQSLANSTNGSAQSGESGDLS